MRTAVVLVLAVLVAMPLAAFAPLARSEETPVRATVFRDEFGVAHVYAEDAYSLFFANGYAQAQDRLAQIEILRHVGKGELASLTGPSGLALDLETRRELYTHEERVEAWNALVASDPAMAAGFAAFADGVNLWIEEAKADPQKLPVEYPALGILPEPWEVYDTIAVAQYLLDVFGRGSGGQEVNNAKLLAQLDGDWDAFADLTWVDHETYTTIKAGDDPTPFAALPAERRLAEGELVPEQIEAMSAALSAAPVADTTLVGEVRVPPSTSTSAPAFAVGDPSLAEVRERVEKYAIAVATQGLKWGSNAQTLDERFAANGKPLLYGGPQMGYFTPMIPYEIGLHGAGYDAVGMGVAGAPGVIIGRNADMSWTVTSGASDQVDTVAVKLGSGGAETYVVDGVEKAMDCRTERHLVRPGPADFAPSADPAWRPPAVQLVDQRICRTDFGPVLWRGDGYAFASHRSYRGDEVRSGVMWLQIGTIRSLADFEGLFEEFRFTFNFNFATEDGHIAYYHVGGQPLRDERLDPRLPRPAWDSSFDWDCCLGLSDLPHVVDPASGYTVNWNNKPDDAWSSGDSRENWGSIHRAEMMEETLLARIAAEPDGKLVLDDLRAVNEHASTHEPYADDVYPTFLAASAMDEDALGAVQAWAASGFDYADRDQDGFHDHAAFRLYERWMDAMMHRTFEDDLGAFAKVPRWDPGVDGADPHAADHGEHGNPFNVLVDAIGGTTSRAWCDVQATDVTETCDDVATAAMIDALAGGVWDDPLPTRTSKFTALGAGNAYEIPMTNRPSFQHFYDWGVPEGADRSRNAVPPGVSGHMNALDFLRMQGKNEGFPQTAPLAAPPPHLDDQLQMYVDFEDKHLVWDGTAFDLGMKWG